MPPDLLAQIELWTDPDTRRRLLAPAKARARRND
jgi:hypothetical protein